MIKYYNGEMYIIPEEFEEERMEAERNAFFQGVQEGMEKLAHEIKEAFNNELPSNYSSTQPFFTLENARALVDMTLKDQKGETE